MVDFPFQKLIGKRFLSLSPKWSIFFLKKPTGNRFLSLKPKWLIFLVKSLLGGRFKRSTCFAGVFFSVDIPPWPVENATPQMVFTVATACLFCRRNQTCVVLPAPGTLERRPNRFTYSFEFRFGDAAWDPTTWPY